MVKKWLFGTNLKTSLAIVLLFFFSIGCKEDGAGKNLKKEKAINSLAKNDSDEYSVKEAMALYRLKGLSVAVIDNYQIIWTDTWGVKDAATGDLIDDQTSFSVGSLAKPITATLFAILEEKGLIDLRDPVSKYLKRWSLPDSKFLEVEEPTFEHLLSHTSGTTQSGFEDFYEGDSIPSLLQSINGQIPGYDKEIEFLWVPGTYYEYSGGGYVIAQMALEDSLKAPLAELAERYLFNPLNLKRTTMRQPNEPGFLPNVAKAHDQFGKIVRTGIPITPQVAASGLWSTPKDLAKIIIELQNALRGSTTTVISHHVAKRVTDIITSKVTGGSAIGWERRFGFCNYEWFSHSGSNKGTGGYMLGSMTDGKGIVMMGNGDRIICLPIEKQLTKSVMSTYDWYKPIDRSNEKPLNEILIHEFIGKYIHSLSGERIEVVLRDRKLFFRDPSTLKLVELIHVGSNTFLIDEFVSKVHFEKKESDGRYQLIFTRNITGEKTTSFIKE